MSTPPSALVHCIPAGDEGHCESQLRSPALSSSNDQGRQMMESLGTKLCESSVWEQTTMTQVRARIQTARSGVHWARWSPGYRAFHSKLIAILIISYEKNSEARKWRQNPSKLRRTKRNCGRFDAFSSAKASVSKKIWRSFSYYFSQNTLTLSDSCGVAIICILCLDFARFVIGSILSYTNYQESYVPWNCFTVIIPSFSPLLVNDIGP